MPGGARSGHGVLARWRARLHGLGHVPASDEREEMVPADRGDDLSSPPPPSLDEVLRDAAQQRDPGDGQEGGNVGPTPT
ncbi:MAG TPA: hypothetical protein VNU75_10585 [Acidimicrobiales bacterium]|nr:hypothetical protein [Acidimicrobiales bacterium]